MKTIYLLRHAKSSWKDSSLADIDRPLSGRGEAAAEAMAAYLEREGLAPDLVLCSPAERARTTLDRIRGAFADTAVQVVEEVIYDADAGGLMGRLHSLDDVHDSVMLIGHNPAMEELARTLVGGGDADARERMAAKYPTAALAVIEADVGTWRDVGPGGGRLVRFVRPADIA